MAKSLRLYVDKADHAMRQQGATISECGTYRYRLWRRWASGPIALFVMLNPSTADALNDDPTVRRCLGFARSIGCGGLEVANLYAWRDTEPDNMFRAFVRFGADIIGPENDATIAVLAKRARDSGGIVIAAWGSEKRANSRGESVLAALSRGGDVHALKVSSKGKPYHPLYLPAALRPVVIRGAA